MATESDNLQRKAQAAFAEAFNELPVSFGQERHLQSLGFDIGEGEYSDFPFMSVIPPEGWELRPSEKLPDLLFLNDHSGRRRGRITLKVSEQYGRFGEMKLLTRFWPTVMELDKAANEAWNEVCIPPYFSPAVFDECMSRWTLVGEPIAAAGTSEEAVDMTIGLRKKAELWLDRKYPEWSDPAAYWDSECEITGRHILVTW